MTKERSKRLISRRETLRLMGIAGATTLAGFRGQRASSVLPAALGGSLTKASPLSCVVRPAQTEGPFFVDERLNRSDIRTDPTNNSVSPGVPLTLNIKVSYVSGNSCASLPGAYVDIWHCDASGSYSDVANAVGRKYLRGYQVTDGDGSAQFQTIYPGWYMGRAVHIHFKIRLFTGAQTSHEFTSQLYFDDSLTDQVYTQSPYNTRGARDRRNSRDGIYRNGGSQLTLAASKSGRGYAAAFDIGLEGITIKPGAPPEISK